MAEGHICGALRLLTSNGTIVFALFLVMVGAGGTSLFGLYSSDIKSTFGYNQYQLNILSCFKDLGASLEIFSGLMAEVYPIWLIFLFGSMTNLTGNLLIWFSYTNRLPGTQFWHLCSYLFIAATSKAFLNSGCQKALKNHFPQKDRPSVVLSGISAIGSTTLTHVLLIFYGHEFGNGVLILGIIPTSVSIACIYTLSARKEDQKKEDGEYSSIEYLRYISPAFAFVMLLITLLQNFIEISRLMNLIAALATLIAIITIPCYANVKWLFGSKPNNSTTVLSNPEKHVKPGERIPNPKEGGTSTSIRSKVVSKKFLVVLFASLVGVGSTTAALDQVGQVSRSISLSSVSVEILVGYCGIMNFVGRLITKIFYDQTLKNSSGGNKLGMVLGVCLMVTHLSIAMPMYSGKSLYVSYIFLSVCHGSMLQLATLTMLDQGKEGLALRQIIKVTIPFGCFVLKVCIIAPLFEMNLTKQDKDFSEGPPICIGSKCFRASFIAMALTAVMVSILWGYLWFCEDKKKGEETGDAY